MITEGDKVRINRLIMETAGDVRFHFPEMPDKACVFVLDESTGLRVRSDVVFTNVDTSDGTPEGSFRKTRGPLLGLKPGLPLIDEIDGAVGEGMALILNEGTYAELKPYMTPWIGEGHAQIVGLGSRVIDIFTPIGSIVTTEHLPPGAISVQTFIE